MRFFAKEIPFIATALLLTCSARAGNSLSITQQIADLNPGAAASSPSNFVAFAGPLYFSAYTSQYGRELWKYDGAAITLAADINNTFTDAGLGVLIGNNSDPAGITAYHDKLYFSAFDSKRGGELWSFDQTNAVRVADINADADDTIKTNPNNSWPSELTLFNDVLYFSAANGKNESNYEFWKYDGTNATMVTNINSGNNASSFPRGFKVFKNALYFMADDGNHGFELWKYNGSQAALFDIDPGSSNSSAYPKNFFEFNDNLYFQAFHSAYGFELWKTDGTNVSLAADINAGVGDSNPEFLTSYNGALYFRASDGIHGAELWKTDGTNFAMVADINLAGDSNPKNLTVFNNQLFFAADDGVNGWELWKFDGVQTALVTNLNTTGDSFPESLTVFDNQLYFVANTPETGYELWRCDGTNVTLAADINPGANSSFPRNLKAFNNQLVFSADASGSFDFEPWAVITGSLEIQSIQVTNNQAQIFWNTLAGTTNFIQASATVEGPYTNLSGPINITGFANTTTNYIDAEPATEPSRFYRVIAP